MANYSCVSGVHEFEGKDISTCSPEILRKKCAKELLSILKAQEIALAFECGRGLTRFYA